MPKGGKPAKRRSASVEELQAVDCNTVTKSKKVKYDPNRLIFGATADGFMELEEVDMDEVNGMLGVTGGGGVASNAKDTPPSTPEDDAEPIKGAKKAVTKKTKADVAGKKASAEKKQSAAASLRSEGIRTSRASAPSGWARNPRICPPTSCANCSTSTRRKRRG